MADGHPCFLFDILFVMIYNEFVSLTNKRKETMEKKSIGKKIVKIVLIFVVFAGGVMVGKHCMNGKKMHHKPAFAPEFVNGCLDMSKIQCPKKAEMLTATAENSDNCITEEEFKAMDKSEMHQDCPKKRGEKSEGQRPEGQRPQGERPEGTKPAK